MTFREHKQKIPGVETPANEDAYFYLYSRDSGDFVVVVIDDECHAAPRESEHTPRDYMVLPLLREQAETYSQIQAIGFFPLAKDVTGADKVLKCMIEWINNFSDGTRVYFLVDVIFGYGDGTTVDAAPHTIKQLTKTYHYPSTRIAYFSRAGISRDEMEGKYRIISKSDVASSIQDNQRFSLDLRLFFGMLHDDEVINDTIQFYTKAWQAGWEPEGWVHNELENKCSDHLQALADWLGDSIDVGYLYNWQQGESAKCLMMWLETDLWAELRQIQRTVLNAVLEKLLPSTKICPLEAESIVMPCTPCFPFLVSLRSFLLRCHDEDAAVSEIRFIPDVKKCTLRLIINLENHQNFENRFRETHCKYKKSPPDEHPFTRSLIYLIYCMTEGIANYEGRDHMRLFTEGTKDPAVQVGIEADYIDLIW